jgi:Ca2+-binding EF-hand superfamily protein
VDELSKIVNKERALFYRSEDFDSKFDEFDDNNQGYLSKGEMAQFIKFIFREPNVSPNRVKVSRVKSPELKPQKTLGSYLG